MAFKTNKSYAKRLKITRNGKILGRKAGHDHFNAKQRRKNQLKQKKLQPFQMDRKDIGTYLPHN
ncbi:MAG: 50S ribosomal protein L35 [Candidatus Pacebacteria bacterium]|nr:50S ribosomal protein L35 [Candidatus Paceibacterota bacterium]NUQ57239.1 50S ribosomal protein L35 [Candidatus Paceibacter sp.]